MVEAVRRARGQLGGGRGAARSSGVGGERCQQRGLSPFANGRARTGEERLPQRLASWQLFCSVQRGL